MSGCSRSGGFVCPRSLRNSTNRISKQRELSRTAAGIHTSSARLSCSLRTTNTARSLWPAQSAFYATGHSRRLFGPPQGRGVQHRHVIMRWATYPGGGKGVEAGDRRAPGAVPHCEPRSRCASSPRVIDKPTRRAKASGVISRTAPHLQVTRTRKSPKQSSSFWTIWAKDQSAPHS